MDNPVSGFIIILPMVIPTVPFCIPDSIATVTDCRLFILNQFELLYPIISIETINSTIAGPIWGRLFIKVCHSLNNANTIIINNAQNFGLSDLHQMRGRVGRSNKKAFCYLISPPTHQISDDSRKRLNALEQFSNIGSGFKIAMRDLDIRGAGDLLGADQSGFINEIGFEMYQRILDEAIEELKEEKFKNLFHDEKEKFIVKDCQLDTDLEILIPEEYVSNVEERINLYQQLNKIDDYEELNNFKNKLIDRFGKTPKELEILFSAVILKWIGKEIGFEKIIFKNNIFRGYFTSNKKSIYFESKQFKKVLSFLKNKPKSCELKEVKDKLVLKKENLTGIDFAINFLNEIKSQFI